MMEEREDRSRQLPAGRNEGERNPREDDKMVLARMLRHMPDREPPPDLAEMVLRSLTPKRLSTWRRLYLWFWTPRTLTISPIKLIPAAAVLAGLIVAAAATIGSRPHGPPGTKPQAHMLVPVSFTLQYPEAHSVSLIGSFNQWNPAGFEMHRTEEGRLWVLEVRLSEGRYRYAFLVDGRMVVADPRSPFLESDGFGHRNSIILVTGDYEKEV